MYVVCCFVYDCEIVVGCCVVDVWVQVCVLCELVDFYVVLWCIEFCICEMFDELVVLVGVGVCECIGEQMDLKICGFLWCGCVCVVVEVCFELCDVVLVYVGIDGLEIG